MMRRPPMRFGASWPTPCRQPSGRAPPVRSWKNASRWRAETSRLLDVIQRRWPRAGSDGAERLAREASFHDHAFAAHTRKKAWKFYDVGRDAYDRYDELLTIMVTPGSSVLEYGCGPAGRAFDLARRGAMVHGIDISPVAIGVARETARRQRVEQNTIFSVMDAEALDLPAGSFDVVCGTSIIHHLDIDRAYREVARVLRPTGRAVFLEPLGHNPVIQAYRRLTPGLRTADEHPLRLADVNAARAYFGDLRVEHFTLLSLAAVAAHGRPSFERVAGVLRRIDRELFTTVPSLRRWSWTIVMTLSQPRPG
jgi:SAM-dependent methyltransferase